MSDPVDVRPDHLEIVQKLLREHLPAGVTIWVFGSRADWSTKDSSDLDVALEGEGPLSNEMLSGLRRAFEESSLPYTVDVVDMNRIGDSFKAILESQKVRLHVDDDSASERNRIEHPQSGGTGGVDARNRVGPHWQHRAALANLIDLQLSSVDKKSKPGEREVQLCNYMDVYNNSFIHSGIEFMRATATDREISNCSLAVGDVVITKDSEKYDDIGVPALVRDDVPNLLCGYHLAILRPRHSVVDGSYLFYALSTPQAQRQFHSFANGITRFGLRKSDIGLVEIPVPPLAAQREIARVLRALDEKIELNRRMNETLESMSRALFKSWFVDFDPVRAKMNGRWRSGETLPGLPAHLYDLFPDRLVDSELGDVPDGWAVRALGELFAPKNFKLRQGNAPEYSCTNTGLMLRSTRFSKRLSTSNSNNKVVHEGDFVFGLSRKTLNFGLMRDEVGCVSPAYKTYTTDKTKVIPNMLERIMRIQSNYFYQAVSASSREGQSISQESLLRLKIALPELPIQESLDRNIRKFISRPRHLAAEVNTLRAVRDALMPKLISGELRINRSR